MAPRRAKAHPDFKPQPFTVREVKELFIRERIVRVGKPPNAEGFLEIEYSLNHVQRRVALDVGPWRKSNDLNSRIVDALESLARDIPALCSNLRKGSLWEEGGNQLMVRAYESDVIRLEGLSSAITAFGPPRDCMGLKQILEVTPRIERWHDYAPVLVKVFTVAMRATNPGIKPGKSNEGPYQRFIAAVVPRISNENPTPGAIGKFLKTLPRPGT